MDIDMKELANLAVDYTLRLLQTDSPTGYTQKISGEVMDMLVSMGFSPTRTRKGCVLCTIGGSGKAICLSAHLDTLGLMVRMIKPSGALAFTTLGNPMLSAAETEDVRLYTRDGRLYTGVVELCNASSHVNRKARETLRDDTTLEVLLDENVSSKEETQALGISVGDIICLEPRAKITESGYIRSRFLDDKLSAGMLLALAKTVADGKITLVRKTTLYFSVYEEVGHGAAAGIPSDTQDLLAVDMGCVGEELSCKETQVSICAKDSDGPYDYTFTSELIAKAQQHHLDYAVDVYPHYGSDAGAALSAGLDVRFGLIGAGVYASHGYERSHMKGVENTMGLIAAVVGKN